MASDQFPLHTCFPDAAAIFHRTFKSIEDIKDTCLVALDTNVLLAPYNLSEEPLAQINSTYRNLASAKRLFIPGQVAREFARNRSGKMGDLLKTVLDQISRQSNPMAVQFSFLKQVPEYEAALHTAKEIEEKQKVLQKQLRDVSEKIRTWETSDPVWNLYRELFGQSILELSSESLNDIPKELKFRTDHNIPPGYKDAQKADGGAGDLIIWKTILQAGKDQKRDVVFVTLDQKQDWWAQAAGGPLYPRIELLEEFSAGTGGYTLRLLRFSEFLAIFGAKENVVQEVQRVEHEADASSDPEEELPREPEPRLSDRERSQITARAIAEVADLRRVKNIITQELVEQYELRRRLQERGASEARLQVVEKRIDSLKVRRRGVLARLNVLVSRFAPEPIEDDDIPF